MKPLGLLALLLPVAAGSTANLLQFRGAASLVRLEVSVTDDHGGVPGLRAGDFIVEDRGARQAIRVDEFTDAPLDVVFVAPPLSAVAFIAADQMARFSAGVTAFLDQVQARDRLGVVLAAPPPRRLRSLEEGRPAFGLEAFRGGSEYYSTSFDAIALALRVFDTSDRRQALVAFTNAADFRSVLSSDTVAELAGRRGPALVLVGTPVTVRQNVSAFAELVDGRPLGDPVTAHVSGGVLPAALDRLAQKSGGAVINLGDGDPRVLMQTMFTSLRTGYVLTYELPQGKGWHPVKVKVNRRGVNVAVRDGYFVD